MEHKIYSRYPLGNKRFQWKQKEFALSTFNCIGKDMDMAIRHCKEVGFNLLELGWGEHDKVWEAVEKCEQYGIDLLFQDLTLFGGMMHRHDDRPVKEETIRDTVRQLQDKKHTVGYYVWDEPYDEALFTEARRQSDILLKYAPGALLFSVFPPSYNPGPTWDNGQYYEAFEEYIKQLDPPVVSMDYYPIGNYAGHYPGLKYTDEEELDNSPLWLDLAVIRNLSAKYNLPFWFYYQGCGVFQTEKLTFPMVRAMMHAGALYGAKGLQNYTATGTCHLPVDGKPYPTKSTVLLATGEKGEFFEQQKEIHEVFRQLGQTLMALTNKAVYHSNDVVPYGKYGKIFQTFKEDIADSDLLASALPARTTVGELTDDYGNHYLYILNRDFCKPLKAELPLKGCYHLYEVNPLDGKQYLISQNTTSIPVSLQNGDAVLIRVQPACEEPFTLEYRLV